VIEWAWKKLQENHPELDITVEYHLYEEYNETRTQLAIRLLRRESNWLKYYGDTIIVASFASLIAVITGSFTAYSFARYNFRFKNFFMIFILTFQMISGPSIIIPLYNMFANLNLLDTYIVLILVDSVGTMPLIIWLIRGYFSTIPVTSPLAAPGI